MCKKLCLERRHGPKHSLIKWREHHYQQYNLDLLISGGWFWSIPESLIKPSQSSLACYLVLHRLSGYQWLLSPRSINLPFLQFLYLIAISRIESSCKMSTIDTAAWFSCTLFQTWQCHNIHKFVIVILSNKQFPYQEIGSEITNEHKWENKAG